MLYLFCCNISRSLIAGEGDILTPCKGRNVDSLPTEDPETPFISSRLRRISERHRVNGGVLKVRTARFVAVDGSLTSLAPSCIARDRRRDRQSIPKPRLGNAASLQLSHSGTIHCCVRMKHSNSSPACLSQLDSTIAVAPTIKLHIGGLIFPSKR